MGNVLLVDDDEKLGHLLIDYFAQFELSVQHALKPSTAFDALRLKLPDIIVLDVMLPEMDGFDVCRKIRSNPKQYGQIPIIMLTARGDVTDRIVGLEIGADDYLPKPFEPRELVARIQNILRRSTPVIPSAQTFTSDTLIVDTVIRNATLDQQSIELTTMEYELIILFMKNPNRTYSRDEIMNGLRGIDADLYSRAVDTLVSRLRHKLNDTSKKARFIKTIWGTGYAFIGNVST